jgi:hypothetical protein
VGFPHVQLVSLPVSERGISTRPNCVPSRVRNVCLYVSEKWAPMYPERGLDISGHLHVSWGLNLSMSSLRIVSG